MQEVIVLLQREDRQNLQSGYSDIDRIVIDPIYQGLGYGRMFYDNLQKFADQRFPRITCEVNLRPKNATSLRFHQRYGFRRVGVQETEGGAKQVSLMVYEMP